MTDCDDHASRKTKPRGYRRPLHRDRESVRRLRRAERKRLAETLAKMVGAAKTKSAADLATGPGTLALRFAPT